MEFGWFCAFILNNSNDPFSQSEKLFVLCCGGRCIHRDKTNKQKHTHTLFVAFPLSVVTFL